jgi:multiple sugar transport system substrate-binding protein
MHSKPEAKLMQRKSNISGPVSSNRRLRGPKVVLSTVYFIAVAACCFALGCGNTSGPTNTEEPAKPLANRIVKVACPSGPRGSSVVRLLERYGRAWAARTGAQVVTSTYDPGAGPDSGTPADVWIVPPAEMPRWAAGGLLQPVPDAVLRDPAYDWDKLLPLYKSVLLVWDGKVHALPVLGETWLCFYRRDLFQDARERAGYRRFLESKRRPVRDLAAPQTWTDFADTAEYFHNRPRPGIDHSCASLPPLADDDERLDRLFYSIAAPLARRAIPEDEKPRPPDVEVFPFHYDLDGRQPRINSAGFVRALDLLGRLQAYRPAATTSEPEQAFQSGEAVLCLASPASIARFQDATSRVRGKVGFCRVPGSEEYFPYPLREPRPARRGANLVPYLGAGGWLAVVPRTAAEPQAAFDLLADLSGPRTSLQAALEPAWGGCGFRREHFEERSGWSAFGLGPEETVQLRQMLQQTMNPALINPVARLRIPDEREHFRSLVKAVRSALTERVPAHKALDEAARDWERIDQRKALEQRRRDYQLSLGLMPGP